MYIYKITNKISGKMYIGQTTNIDPEKRIKAHFKKTNSKDLVRDAAKKYGKEALSWEIIYYAFDQNELNQAEKYFIQEYKTLVPNGYNIQQGGNSTGRWTEESKIQNGLRVKEYYSKNQHPFKGNKFSKSHCESLSKVRKGFDSEARKKVRETCHKDQRVAIRAINITTKEEFVFESIRDCALKLNLIQSCVCRALHGKQNRTQHKGYRFISLDKQE